MKPRGSPIPLLKHVMFFAVIVAAVAVGAEFAWGDRYEQLRLVGLIALVVVVAAVSQIFGLAGAAVSAGGTVGAVTVFGPSSGTSYPIALAEAALVVVVAIAIAAATDRLWTTRDWHRYS